MKYFVAAIVIIAVLIIASITLTIGGMMSTNEELKFIQRKEEMRKRIEIIKDRYI